MMVQSEHRPDLAHLLARFSAFLDGAEDALKAARPEEVVQATGEWARLCRELRRVSDDQWPSAEHRVAIMGQMATRTAALQQAVVRALARLERELNVLEGSAGAGPSGEGDAAWRMKLLTNLTYDSVGGRPARISTGRTYA